MKFNLAERCHMITLVIWIIFISYSRGEDIKNERRFQKFSYISNFTDDEIFQSSFTQNHLQILKNETQHLFNYAWGKYLQHGFPFDEVKPISCEPNYRDWYHHTHTVRNDVVGNFSATLFDAMDTFVIMDDYKGFKFCVDKILDLYQDFAIDSNIQVFETNIRILGSLITGHLFAIDPRRGFVIDGYKGGLLKLAYDLGKRLSLSFLHDDDDEFEPLIKKLTKFPFPRTNLLWGPKYVPSDIQVDQCLAGMTSLTIEFGLLSRLTNDTLFDDLARDSVIDFWAQRSKLNLMPMSYRVDQRRFVSDITGVGASIDSFYEYALKYSILFDDEILYEIWKDSYTALLTHSQNEFGIFQNVNSYSGLLSTEWLDSLAAFFPGLQVLGGDILNAQKLHLVYMKLWNHYGAIPERWNFAAPMPVEFFSHLKRPYKLGDSINGITVKETDELLLRSSVSLEWYPLRPEMIESAYYLYQATHDPIYLRLGEHYLQRIRNELIAPCGFSSFSNVITGEKEDRMESFVLSETLKYLYLLFQNNPKVHKGNTIFTTEGHPVWWDKKIWSYDPIEKSDILKMNEISIENVQSQNFVKKWLHRKKSELNQEFKRLKEKYYKKQDRFYTVRPSEYNLKAIKEILEDFEIFQEHEAYMINESVMEKIRIINKNISLSTTDLSSDYLFLDKCMIHKQTHSKDFLFSDILSNNENFYNLEEHYAATLRSPSHMKGSEFLELSSKFYNRFTPLNKPPISKAKPHTIIIEGVISANDHYDETRIFRYDDSILIPEFDEVRMRFLVININDTMYFGCSDYFLNRLSGNETEVILLSKINGREVGCNQVMIGQNSRAFNENKELIYKDGSFYLTNKPVINMIPF
ncbi:alpha-1,2-mannosidase [Martiniozyma asiatica (nom. inval.)]|nr:alpha-1,2-mannosidase [Martiniozyma asiatica]